MASKPPLSDDKIPASAADSVAPELDEKPAADADATDRVMGGKTAASSPPDDDEEDDDDLDIDDDEEDEDLVVFTAKEAAGALATIYAFIKPFLKNYRKMLVFVSVGVV